LGSMTYPPPHFGINFLHQTSAENNVGVKSVEKNFSCKNLKQS
jgi:hypothetical protein